MKTCTFGIRILGIIGVLSLWSFAQTSTGSISGLVEDESHSVIPGANVVVTNVDTGISRSVVTDGGGRYRVPGLIPAHYELQAQREGFATEIRKGIQLTVSSDLEINMVLKVGQVTQKTVVSAEAPMVETITGTVSGLVDEKSIQDLPLNGRSFDQLISLQSSAPVIHFAGHTNLTGSSDAYSVNGARGQSNLFVMDGTELIGAGSITTLPGGALGKNMGVEAIQEFTVLSSNYSAAYGKRAGGIINIATRAGTNQIHGSAFEFLRNDNLDARDFFNVVPGDLRRSDPPEFRRNQFGGSLGGPIWKDQTFYFGTYEGLREGLGLTRIDFVPDDNARQGLLPDRQNPGRLIDVGVAPEVKPFLVVFPPANGRNFGDGIAEALYSPTQVSSQDFLLARIDHKLSDKDFLFGRYNFTKADQHEEGVLFAASTNTSAHVITLEEKRAYATTLNTIRLGFSRATTYSDRLPTIPLDSSLVFLPGAPALGNLNFGLSASGGVGGALSDQGTGNSAPRHFVINQWDVSDQVFHQRGPHALQFGVQLQRFQSNGDFGDSKRGLFQFSGLESFLRGQATLYRAPDPRGSGDATKAYRQIYVDAYVQDDYKVRRNLTLNLGLRYEGMTPPTEASGNRISNYHTHLENGLRVLDSTPTLGSPFYESRRLNFAPRLGFAWDTFGDGKMAVRGGFGLFYDQIQSEYRFFTANNAPFFSLLEVNSPPFPYGFSRGFGQEQALPQVDALDFFLNVPTRLQYNLSLQRQITANTVLNIGYVGSHSYHLTRQLDMNTALPQIQPDGTKFYPSIARRKNPAVGRSRFITSDAISSYNSLQMDVTQRLTHGLRSKVSFSYSKNTDNASAVITQHARATPAVTEDPDNLRLDRGLSSFDIRRNLTVNFTYNLPGSNFAGMVAKLLGGWQVGGVVTLSDGMPLSMLTGFSRSRDQATATSDRPNLKSGATNNPILGGPDRYFDPGVLELPLPGTYGNLGRNTLIGPGFATVDFNLAKISSVNERLKADFRAEFFNILNHANFSFPSNAVFTSSGAVRGAAGRISETAATSRQIQFGLKLVF